LPVAPWSLTESDAYLAEVKEADDALGSLIDSLSSAGRLAWTHLIVTSPRGHATESDPEAEVGLLLLPSTVSVPLIWKAPERSWGVREGLVWLCDIPPTLLDLAGARREELRVDPAARGISLSAVLEGKATPGRNDLLIEALSAREEYGWAPIAGLATPEGLLCLSTLAHEFPTGTAKASPENARRLRSLVDSLAPEADPLRYVLRPGTASDPYQMVRYHNSLLRSWRAILDGNPARARRLARPLMASLGKTFRARLLDAWLDLSTGHLGGLGAKLDSLQRLAPGVLELRLARGMYHLDQGNPTEALRALTASGSSNGLRRALPRDPRLLSREHMVRAQALCRLERFDEAAQEFRQAQRLAVERTTFVEAGRRLQSARFLADIAKGTGEGRPEVLLLAVESALILELPESARNLLAESQASGGGPREIVDWLKAEIQWMEGRGSASKVRETLERVVRSRLGTLRQVLLAANAMMNRGRYEDAASVLEACFQFYDKSRDLYLALVRAKAHSGRTAEAEIHLKSAVRYGFRDWQTIVEDPTLLQICRSPRVSDLLPVHKES